MRRTVAIALLLAVTAACGGEGADGTTQPPDTTVPPSVATTAPDGADTIVPEQTTTPPPPPTESTTTTPGAQPTDTPTTVATDTTVPDPTTTASTSVPATTTTIPEPMLPPSPLTGLGVENPEALSRRTMAVKVDNHWDARPQTGIGQAETVFEILVEGGITRFIALYHTVDPPAVGPVRSVRPTDPHLLRHFNATLLTSGGQDWILRLFPRNGVGVISEIGVGGYRDAERSAPHNYYVTPSEMRPVADERLYPNTAPPPLFEFGDLPANAVLGSVFQVEMEWAPTNVITWQWNGIRWERHLSDGPHLWVTAEGQTEILTADTLVVLFSGLFYTQPPSGSGYALPTMETTGKGRALVFSRGQVVAGEWVRPDTSQPFALILPDGFPMTVPPGRSWISLFPEGRPVTW